MYRDLMMNTLRGKDNTNPTRNHSFKQQQKTEKWLI